MKAILLLGIMAVIFLVACAPAQQAPEVQDGPIKIGFVGPLTGDVSFIGQQTLSAVELAVEEVNTAGGINGRMIELIVEDGKCNAKDASTAGNKLISVDKVKYIIGGECSGETLAIAPVAEANQVVMLSPVSSSPSVTDAGDFIFRDYMSDNAAGKKVAEVIYNSGATKVALLHSLNDWADGVSSVFATEFEALGGEIVVDESFEQGSADLRNVVTKVKASDAEAVALFEYTNGAITYFKQAEELGVNLPTYGGDTFADPAIADGAGAAFDGAQYVAPANFATDEFRAKLLARSGDDDLVVGTPNAYDALYIFANAIEAVGDDSVKVKEYFYVMEPYQGESGLISFDENGDLTEAPLAVNEIVNGKSVVVAE